MIGRRLLLLLSLFAYFWTASCLGEALLIHELAVHHDEATFSVPGDNDRELVFHHAGHPDEHESDITNPHITDEHTAAGHHSDHVVTLGCEQLADASISKDFKAGSALLAI